MEVEKPHGRLIDADAMLQRIASDYHVGFEDGWATREIKYTLHTYLDIYEWIKEYVESQPTVIPPEEAGDKNNNKEG